MEMTDDQSKQAWYCSKNMFLLVFLLTNNLLASMSYIMAASARGHTFLLQVEVQGNKEMSNLDP